MSKVGAIVRREFVERVLAVSALANGHFDVVISADDVAAGKPAPDIYLAACTALGAAPERSAALEDSPTGVAAARAAGRQMLKQGQGGKIILTSSARGLLGHPAGYTAYCASKSAVDGITKALGCELGATGITVNALGPTVFRSPLTEWMYQDTERAKGVRAGFLTRVPKGRLGEPEDLAGPILFLASKASDFYTGHILYADGGYTAG